MVGISSDGRGVGEVLGAGLVLENRWLRFLKVNLGLVGLDGVGLVVVGVREVEGVRDRLRLEPRFRKKFEGFRLRVLDRNDWVDLVVGGLMVASEGWFRDKLSSFS